MFYFQPEMWVRPQDGYYEGKKVKGVNESDEERILRITRRHQKFGKLAKILQIQFDQPSKLILLKLARCKNRRVGEK